MKKLVELREWRIEDIQELCIIANNKKIADNLRNTFPHPYTEEHARIWVEKNMHARPAKTYAIAVNGILAGGIGLHIKSDIYSQNAELGYWLGEPYWNQGISTIAVKKMVIHAFSTFNTYRIYASVFENNHASMRVLEKAGFIKEAVLKKSVMKNGWIQDEYIYRLLRDEFQVKMQQ